MVVCKLCLINKKDITKHIIKIHKISTKKYKEIYPDSQLVDIDVIKKRGKSIIEYNLKNPIPWNKGKKWSKEIKEKIKRRLNDKKIRQKARETLLKKYGVDNPMKCLKIREKAKQTLIKRYGVDNYAKSKKYREKFILNKLKNLLDCKLIEKYDYNKGYDKFYKFKCNKCSSFFISQLNRQYVVKCDKCYNKYKRIEEQKLKNWIKSLNISFISNNRSLIYNGKIPLELDIYIPDKKIAIEYNGLIWHSSKYVNKNYHLFKTNKCLEKGIQLIHIFEDEWIYKQEIVKSILKRKLRILCNKIYARNTSIREVSTKEAKEFLIKNHLQGYAPSKIKIALFYNDEIVSIMTFGKKRNSISGYSLDKEWELIRLASKLNTIIIGGSLKLFSYFVKKYKPNNVISYCDRRYFTGEIYEKLGFKFIRITKPNYYYVFNRERKNRLNFQKHKISDESNKHLTEKQIMENKGIYYISDIGNKVYLYSK